MKRLGLFHLDSRKTEHGAKILLHRIMERGAKAWLHRIMVRAVPFALHLDPRKTERGAKAWLHRIMVRAVPFALVGVMIPGVLFGQKKEDFIALQRDVAALEEQVKGLQKSQDDKFAALQGLIQQAIEASTRVNSAMTGLQSEVDKKLNDQQSKLVAPIATVGSKVDQMSDDFRAVGNSVSDLVQRVNSLDTKLKDISDAIRILQTPPAAAPAPVTSQIPAAPACPTSADTLWENARRDYSGGKTDLAQQEYEEYVKCYHDTANAPLAAYKIGQMYFDGGSYDNAVQAFDAALTFPENPSRPEAMYYKAVALMKNGSKTEAGDQFKEFIRTYPHDPHVAMAHTNLRTLGLEPKSKKR